MLLNRRIRGAFNNHRLPARGTLTLGNITAELKVDRWRPRCVKDSVALGHKTIKPLDASMTALIARACFAAFYCSLIS